ncbi:hypothetical protein B0H13DRAFT_2273577 [Mycena leptocephala]|nr:hypothetical protein B0H13DRAFT_2273577 [Mycena leptocephala]
MELITTVDWPADCMAGPLVKTLWDLTTSRICWCVGGVLSSQVKIPSVHQYQTVKSEESRRVGTAKLRQQKFPIFLYCSGSEERSPALVNVSECEWNAGEWRGKWRTLAQLGCAETVRARRREICKNGGENAKISHSPAMRRRSEGRPALRRPEEWRREWKTEKSRTALLCRDGPWPRVTSRARQSIPCFAKGARRRDIKMVQRMEGRMEKSRTARLCGDGPWPGVTSRAQQSILGFAKGARRYDVRMVQRKERK